MKQFISWVIIMGLTESESILIKRGIEAHFRARLQPYLGPLLQGQTRIAKLKSAYNSLIIGCRDLGW